MSMDVDVDGEVGEASSGPRQMKGEGHEITSESDPNCGLGEDYELIR